MDVHAGGRVAWAVTSIQVAQGSHGVEGRMVDHTRPYQLVLLQRQRVAGQVALETERAVEQVAAAERGRGGRRRRGRRGLQTRLPRLRASHSCLGARVVRHRHERDHARDRRVKMQGVLGVPLGHGSLQEVGDGQGLGLGGARHDSFDGESQGFGGAHHVAPGRSSS